MINNKYDFLAIRESYHGTHRDSNVLGPRLSHSDHFTFELLGKLSNSNPVVFSFHH